MHPLIRFLCPIAALFVSAPHAADDDDGKQPAASLNTDTSIQQSAAIQTRRLEAAPRQSEFIAFGTALNLEPLLELRQKYLAAQAQQDSAAARYQEADTNLNRTRNLHQQNIVSTRRLQEQQAQWQNDKANLSTISHQQQTILAAGRLQWGDVLTDWFTQSHGSQAEQFLNHRWQLLEITLPANMHLAADIRHIEVDVRGRRDQAVVATLVSPAPQVDPVTQGERYFFKSEGHRLPFGAYITAWIPRGSEGDSSPGVVIPESAVVWHLGQAFVFIKTPDGKFSRRLLPELSPGKNGYFAATGFAAGEEVVTAGAQTLLSQELKSLIPSEDDD